MTLRRLKTYTGSQGYVYQYYFVGKRTAPSDAGSTEYVFDVTTDRTLIYPVSILVPRSVVLGWEESHGRALIDPEQYAAAKLRLFQAFDEWANCPPQARTVQVDSAFFEQALDELGVD